MVKQKRTYYTYKHGFKIPCSRCKFHCFEEIRALVWTFFNEASFQYFQNANTSNSNHHKRLSKLDQSQSLNGVGNSINNCCETLRWLLCKCALCKLRKNGTATAAAAHDKQIFHENDIAYRRHHRLKLQNISMWEYDRLKPIKIFRSAWVRMCAVLDFESWVYLFYLSSLSTRTHNYRRWRVESSSMHTIFVTTLEWCSSGFFPSMYIVVA